jgi:hypothetical protein
MVSLIKHTENNRTHYLIDLGVEFNDRKVYANVTTLIFNALHDDKAKDYSWENGPAFHIERTHCEEYAEYVAAHAIPENLHKFNCRGMMFFLAGVEN